MAISMEMDCRQRFALAARASLDEFWEMASGHGDAGGLSHRTVVWFSETKCL